MAKSRIIILSGVLAVLAVIGWGSHFIYRFIEDDGKQYKTVRLAENTPSLYKLSHYIAGDKSFYRDQGVKIKTVDSRDDREALSSLEKGEADMALVSPTSLILKHSCDLKEGIGPVAFAALDRGNTYHLVARENNPLEDMKTLKRKVIIAGPPNSQETLFLESILRDGGLNPYETVTIMTNIPPEIRMGALKSGTGHYLLVEDKDLPDTLSKGFFKVRSFKTGYPTFVCVTTREFIKNQPEAVQGFTNALYMAQIWMKHHTAGETAAALQDTRGIDKKILPALVESYYSNNALPESPVLQDKNLDLVARILDRSKEIPMPVNTGDLVINQFATITLKTVKYVPEDKQERTGIQKLKFWEGR